MLSSLGAFTTWLVGLACGASGIDTWRTAYRSKRRLYSLMRLGREALVLSAIGPSGDRPDCLIEQAVDKALDIP